MSTGASHYGLVSGIYDILGRFWTRGNIRKSKLWQIQFMKPGDYVLFAGSGTSEEVVYASKSGVNAVIIDLSEKMLSIARSKLAAEGIHDVVFIRGDICDHFSTSQYDVIVANYFLDVFDPSTMKEVLHHLKALLKFEGCLLIAGFTPVKGSKFNRWLAEIHHGIPLFVFHLLAGNALHQIYDYKPSLEELGFEVESSLDFRLFSAFDFGVHAICARKNRRNFNTYD